MKQLAVNFSDQPGHQIRLVGLFQIEVGDQWWAEVEWIYFAGNTEVILRSFMKVDCIWRLISTGYNDSQSSSDRYEDNN